MASKCVCGGEERVVECRETSNIYDSLGIKDKDSLVSWRRRKECKICGNRRTVYELTLYEIEVIAKTLNKKETSKPCIEPNPLIKTPNPIKGFKGYYCDGEKVYKEDGKIIDPTVPLFFNYSDGKKLYKEIKISHKPERNSFTAHLVNDEGKRKTLTVAKIRSLSGFKLKLPDDAVHIPNSIKEYIDLDGNIYSYGNNNPEGLLKKQRIGTEGYPQVTVNYGKQNYRTVETHILMAEIFLDANYRKKNLVVMHKDGNKLNNNLFNLKLVPKSESNKNAYRLGLNTGNKGKKKFSCLIRVKSKLKANPKLPTVIESKIDITGYSELDVSAEEEINRDILNKSMLDLVMRARNKKDLTVSPIWKKLK